MPAAEDAARSANGPVATALDASPVLTAQRRRIQDLGGKGTAQRVKDKPTDNDLRDLVKSEVSSKAGSCCNATVAVSILLAKVADKGDVSAVLLNWIENEGTSDVDVGNHTACVVQWTEDEFVVDTTAGQFGGAAVIIDSVSNWHQTIIGLQKQRVTRDERTPLKAPMSDSLMAARTSNWSFPYTQSQKNDDTPDPPKKKCFLTSACVAHMGLSDDCHELTMLRDFRDGWLAARPDGWELIEEYVRIVPAIVDAIAASGEAHAIHTRIYGVVQNCVTDIEAHRMQEAQAAYVALVRTLQSALALG